MFGNFYNKVTLQQLTTVSAGAGATTATWTDLDTIFCSIQPMTGKYALDVGEITTGYPVKIKTWYREDLDTNKKFKSKEFRLKDGDTIYNIFSVVNVEMKNRTVEMIAYNES